MDELVDVTVKVPQSRIPAFYARVGEWLSDDAVEGPAAPQPWGDDDIALARELLSKLSPPAHRIFDVLGTSAGQKYSADELAATCNIQNGKYGIAGTLAWPGRYCRGFGRVMPIEAATADAEATSYWMERSVALLFARAREA
jgi:hypothetical protein